MYDCTMASFQESKRELQIRIIQNAIPAFGAWLGCIHGEIFITKEPRNRVAFPRSRDLLDVVFL
jgi:hypothetical protein